MSDSCRGTQAFSKADIGNNEERISEQGILKTFQQTSGHFTCEISALPPASFSCHFVLYMSHSFTLK